MAKVRFYYEPRKFVVVDTTEDIAKGLQDLNKQMWKDDFAKREHESATDSDRMALVKDDSSDVEQRLDKRELQEKIEAVLSTLSKEQQHIVDLKFYQDLNDTEISRELGITRQVVQNRIAKIISKIRKKF